MNRYSTGLKDILCGSGKYMLLAWLLSVAGCAIQPGQPGSSIDYRDITVDTDIQKVFDQAVALMQQEQYARAIPLLDQVTASEQRLTAPYINLAIAYEQTGDSGKAVENLEKALAIDAYDPTANNELGLIYRKQGKFELAKKAYITAIEKHPDYLPVIRNLGILCDLYLRDSECALEQYEKYQKLVPEDEKVKIWIADLKQRSGG